ncbi:MAG: hypothetical protein IGR76_12300 [Synechococcales cyanobacterium T60_A2020_003]|nr:hypothetical protein [Synechococcales cyanobacterium T60_A2020_003]
MPSEPTSSRSHSTQVQLAPSIAQFAAVTASLLMLASFFSGKSPFTLRTQSASSPLRCTQLVQPNQTLSREQLTALRNLDGQQQQADLQDRLGQPYCQIATISDSAGASFTGDAYPLEFDPQIWLVVLYSGDAYAGYQFEFRQ